MSGSGCGGGCAGTGCGGGGGGGGGRWCCVGFLLFVMIFIIILGKLKKASIGPWADSELDSELDYELDSELLNK